MACPTFNAADIPITEQHAFCDIAKEFNWTAMKLVVNKNPAIVNVMPCGRQGGRRWSALHQAAHGGNVDAVHFLLEHGASANAKNDNGNTPYDVAEHKGHRHIMECLSNWATGTSKAGHAKRVSIPTPLRAGKAPTNAAKVMKATKSMKCSKTPTKVMKVAKSKIAKGKRSKSLVFSGKFEKTMGGLTKAHLTKSKSGKVVSAKLQARGKKSYANIAGWVAAFIKARKALGVSGFVAVKKGTPLYEKTIEFYKSS